MAKNFTLYWILITWCFSLLLHANVDNSVKWNELTMEHVFFKKSHKNFNNISNNYKLKLIEVESTQTHYIKYNHNHLHSGNENQGIKTTDLIIDVDTLKTLSALAHDAYLDDSKNKRKWRSKGGPFNSTIEIGWDNSSKGVRGYVFANKDKSIVVTAIKGTDIIGPTAQSDRFNVVNLKRHFFY